MDFQNENIPVIPLPNPGEGGPVANPPASGDYPVIPLPNPGEGGPVANPPANGDYPVIPLPNPGEGGPVANPSAGGNFPVIPLPNPGGENVLPGWPGVARIRFINAAVGYAPFRIFVNNRRAVNRLAFSEISDYGRFLAGYRTITVAGLGGYVYMQKTIPFEAGSTSTIAIINRTGGLDMLQIPDICCAPQDGSSNFRVSNLAYGSQPMDVLLGDGRVIYADIRFKETTSYKRIQPGEYQFIFAQTDLMPMPAYMDIESLDSAFIGMAPLPDTVLSLYLDVQSNTNYTVYLLDNTDGTGGMQTLVVEDR